MSAPTTSTTDFDAEDGVYTATAVIDNGTFGSRSVSFEGNATQSNHGIMDHRHVGCA
jgi:hypothetical protein